MNTTDDAVQQIYTTVRTLLDAATAQATAGSSRELWRGVETSSGGGFCI
jgi:hypothetical protein